MISKSKAVDEKSDGSKIILSKFVFFLELPSGSEISRLLNSRNTLDAHQKPVVPPSKVINKDNQVKNSTVYK